MYNIPDQTKPSAAEWEAFLCLPPGEGGLGAVPFYDRKAEIEKLTKETDKECVLQPEAVAHEKQAKLTYGIFAITSSIELKEGGVTTVVSPL